MKTNGFGLTWVPVFLTIFLGLHGCTTPAEPATNTNVNASDDPAPDDTDDTGSGEMPSNDNTDDPATQPEGPTCGEYCQLIQAVCGNAGDFRAQYDSVDACVEYCDTWAAIPPGSDDDVSGNSIGCRIAQTEAASNAEDTLERLELCERAGPSGGNVCGTWCENYCFLSQRNCGGHELHPASETECMAECEAINDQGRPGTLTGNSIQCRITHVGVAGNPNEITGEEDPPAPLDMNGNVVTSYRLWHCPHGSPVSQDADGGTGPCN